MLYLVLAGKGFRRMMAYRAATLAGLVTNYFFGAMRAFIFIALYRGAAVEHVAGYSVTDAITYTMLTQALIAPLMIFGWWDVMRTIRSGDIASDLAKPIDYYGFWLAQDLGRAGFHVLARGIPIVAAYPLFFDVVWPASALTWVAFAFSVLCAVLISFSWRFLVNVSAFWTVDAYGLGRIAFMTVLVLSGFIVPVAYFPDWARTLIRYLPFPAMVNTPVEVYLGHQTGADLAGALAVQVAWVVGLALLARWVYRAGVAKLVVQGG